MIPPGWTQPELARQILVAPRKGLVGMPDTRVIEREGWFQLITPSMKTGGLNEVDCTSLTESEAGSVVDRTLAEYRRLAIRFRWVVTPDTPPFLASLLAARGLKPISAHAVCRSTDPLPGQTHGRVRVDEVGGEDVDDFTRVMAEGWSLAPGTLGEFHRSAVESRTFRLFLARYDGEPAATAGASMLERSVHLLGGVVLPRFRSKGLYRALVAARLSAAAGRGIGLATSLAQEDTSAPILIRLGFESICRVTHFVDG